MDEAEGEAEEAGVNNLIFVQCVQDSPEESLWVSLTWNKSQKVWRIVGGMKQSIHDSAHSALHTAHNPGSAVVLSEIAGSSESLWLHQKKEALPALLHLWSLIFFIRKEAGLEFS